MKVLVTGGAGFIGSHVAEYYAQLGEQVTVMDNLSRARLLGKDDKNARYNWDYLHKYKNISFVYEDVRYAGILNTVAEDADVIIHTAAQTAVTTSLTDPRTDFEVNLGGTFNVLEAARKSGKRPTVIFCSTNKVYGNNVNSIKTTKHYSRYNFEEGWRHGIPETFPIDGCEHTPYGCSKLAADLYVQDYAIRNEISAGVFRMSCIYGTRQFGVEDQGWVAWFCIASLLGKPITIYGDGRQVRDVLYVSDLVQAFDAFIQKGKYIGCEVFNMGGGPMNTISLLEHIDLLEEVTGKPRSNVTFADWRPSDQQVYISDIRKAETVLNWKPKVTPKAGVRKLVEWLRENEQVFK